MFFLPFFFFHLQENSWKTALRLSPRNNKVVPRFPRTLAGSGGRLSQHFFSLCEIFVTVSIWPAWPWRSSLEGTRGGGYNAVSIRHTNVTHLTNTPLPALALPPLPGAVFRRCGALSVGRGRKSASLPAFLYVKAIKWRDERWRGGAPTTGVAYEIKADAVQGHLTRQR